MGKLGVRALRAHRARRGTQHPVRCSAAATLRLGGLLLGDGHRSGILRLSGRPLVTQGIERRPPRVDGLLARARLLVQVDPALGTEAEAVVGAQRRQRELEQYGIPGQGLQIGARRQPADRRRLRRRSPSVSAVWDIPLPHRGADLPTHRAAAAAALTGPRRLDRARTAITPPGYEDRVTPTLSTSAPSGTADPMVARSSIGP